MSNPRFSWGIPDISRVHVERTSDDLFAAPPPHVLLKEIKGDGTGWHDDFATIEWDDIKEWDDFNNEEIDEILKDVAQEPIPWTGSDEHDLRDSRKKTYAIEVEPDVNTMFRESMVPAISKSMNYICPKIRKQLGLQPVALKTEFEGARIRTPKKDNRNRSSKQPDWPIYAEHQSKATPCHIYVAGEAKRHHVFNPAWLKKKRQYDENEARVTLGQVGMYSYYGKTRYGFVITSTTLTVLRYYFISKDAERLRLGVEYKIIPVDAVSPRLTPIKAIVALAVMSMHDKQRAVMPKDQVMPLNTWYQLQKHNGAVVFAHLLTERLESSLPSSGRATSSESALKLLTYTCYQAMKRAVGVPCGAISQKAPKSGLTIKTTERIQSRSRDVLKALQEPKTKVRKAKKSKPAQSSGKRIVEVFEGEYSPTTQAKIVAFYEDLEASKKPRSKLPRVDARSTSEEGKN